MSQQIQGFKELQKALKKLPGDIKEKALQSGVRSAAAQLHKAAVAEIEASDLSPSGKATLRRALRVRASRSKMKRQGFVVASVSIRSGVKAQKLKVKNKDGTTSEENADAWWWPFIELGTRERTRRSGGSTGAVRARHIFKRAFDAAGSGAIDVGSKQIARRVNRELKNMGRS